MSGPLNLTPSEPSNAFPVLFSMAFRGFFLAGSGFALVAILVWGGFLAGNIALTPALGPIYWHIHEMLAGFVGAVAIGFLLTAVQTWTGIRAPQGGQLLALISLWLIARIFALFSGDPALLASASANAALFWIAARWLSKPLKQARNSRNYIFPWLLFMLGAGSLVIHLSVYFKTYSALDVAIHVMVFVITLMMSIIAGRVIPMFTANGTGTEKIRIPSWLDSASNTVIFLVLLGYITVAVFEISATGLALLCAGAALLHVTRAILWKPWRTLKVPLVWSLHLAYWFIPTGLLLMSLHFSFNSPSLSAGVHAITAGAMGCLIIAMISRVSLGHTGRQLSLPRGFPVAYLTVASGAIFRIALSIHPQWQSPPAWLAVALLWGMGFGLFVFGYFPVLTKPRVDGHSG